MTHQTEFKWWFVYGAPRTGSSYMIKTIGLAAKTIISDWNVGNLYHMVGPTDQKAKRPGINFDWDEAFRATSTNLLKNGEKGKGNQLDLAFKQAGGVKDSFPSLVRMWGKPQRTIFCVRNPSSYMSSAIKKFKTATVQGLQIGYLKSFQDYNLIGGDIFEYNSTLSEKDYIDFLSPLVFEDKIKPFIYSGSDSPEYTSEMQSVFEEFRQTHFLEKETK